MPVAPRCIDESLGLAGALQHGAAALPYLRLVGTAILVILLLPVASAVAAVAFARRHGRSPLAAASLALLAFLVTTVALRLAFASNAT